MVPDRVHADAASTGSQRSHASGLRPLLRAALLTLGAGLLAGVAAQPEADAPLLDTVWQLEQIQYMNDTETAPNDPARYTVRFGSDGSLQVRADCNRGVGRYELDGVALTLAPLALTRALCPPDSIDSEFVRELSNVVSFVLNPDGLYLATAIDVSILHFTPAADPAPEPAPEK